MKVWALKFDKELSLRHFYDTEEKAKKERSEFTRALFEHGSGFEIPPVIVEIDVK